MIQKWSWSVLVLFLIVQSWKPSVLLGTRKNSEWSDFFGHRAARLRIIISPHSLA